MANATESFPPIIESARRSRAFVHDHLRSWDAEELRPVAELLTSELVTNVVMHARTLVEVDLDWHDPVLRVEIRDGSSILPAVADLANETGGFGLRLIDSLAAEWGIERRGTGKAVWFTVSREVP